MTGEVGFWAGMLLAALSAAGCVYMLAAVVLVRWFTGRKPALSKASEGVTLLKPLHGAEPRLRDNLATFLAQDHAGAVQMVCGTGNAGDPAAAAVAKLQREHPDRDVALVSTAPPPCANGKVGNLVNMMAAARHDVLVLSDSDMAVAPDYLQVVLGTLSQPGVGAVTCLYRGRGDAGLWSRLSAGSISYWSMPQIVIGYLTGMARPCMGSTIALSRETLDAIGGFARFADVLADDYAIGEAVAARGLRVEIPPLLLVHACGETRFAELWRQKVRWSATIRGVATLRHLGSVITYPLPLALLALPLVPQLAVPLAGASAVLRLALIAVVDRAAGERSASLWQIPAIECIEFAVFIASFFARAIDWRGSRLTMSRDGRITA
jgi:ceramide glucosyltransferase